MVWVAEWNVALVDGAQELKSTGWSQAWRSDSDDIIIKRIDND
jgi:hypothetical protein